MTRYAHSSNVCGIVSPRALAVFRLIDQLGTLVRLDGQVSGLGARTTDVLIYREPGSTATNQDERKEREPES